MAVKNFIWDELSDNVLLETDEDNSTTVAYTNKPGLYGKLLSQNRSGVKSFHNYDGRYSTRQLTGIDGNVTDTTTYSAFGEVVARTGATTNPFGYKGAIGYYTNPTTDDVYVRARTYEPSSGRWLSKDPLGFIDGPNRYKFVKNQPIRSIDPSGTTTRKKRVFIIVAPPHWARNGRSHSSLRDLIDNVNAIVDPETEVIGTLEITGHGNPERICLRDTPMKGNVVANSTLEDTVINGANATFVGQQLAKLPFGCPCLIYLTACNVGILRGKNTWPKKLADETGCDVQASGGYFSGTIFDDDWQISKYHGCMPEWWQDIFGGEYFPESDDHIEGSTVMWLFEPKKPRECPEEDQIECPKPDEPSIEKPTPAIDVGFPKPSSGPGKKFK